MCSRTDTLYIARKPKYHVVLFNITLTDSLFTARNSTGYVRKDTN